MPNVKHPHSLELKAKEHKMLKVSGKKDGGKSTSDKLGIKKNTDRNTLYDLTNNDGSEDPGAELDTITSINKDSEKEHTQPQAEETLNPGLNSANDI